MAYDFVIGVDVGKYFHHACVLDPQVRLSRCGLAGLRLPAVFHGGLSDQQLERGAVLQAHAG